MEQTIEIAEVPFGAEQEREIVDLSPEILERVSGGGIPGLFL